ncbi:MAG: diacylglycerol kinase family protein [Bacteroidetes bacterium]|nr:diacylglycerol kinase family protein [Bacteroidota bacterium]MBU1372781.1 diacylglycerol kinase family protein [Bacteroidota bacterium]MBU1484977.1 diacylglycerol kinase family protein [Bacteroidota bacterium]MBU1761816.1 diacylglycerol kinase family protein [Bacteroidota bacterium]MBU2268716.1 diacylglycerol kinase family protein [Bacteroidota bacterium]
MTNKKFSLLDRIKSFPYAFNGLKILFKEEHNARVHLFIAIFAILAGFILKISAIEWVAVILVIGLVFITEIINTSIENIADFISPEKHPKIKVIKDLAAAAVILSAIVSVMIGLLIFLPKLLVLI